MSEEVVYWRGLSLGFAILLTILGTAQLSAQPLLLLGLAVLIAIIWAPRIEHNHPVHCVYFALVLVAVNTLVNPPAVLAPRAQRVETLHARVP